MADVLAADGGFERTDRPENADVILFNTCSVREKAQERVFHDLGRVRALKSGKPDLIIGVGGCVASQEGAGIVVARALRGRRVRPADAASAPRAHPRAPRDRHASGRHHVSRDREIRPAAAAARRRRLGVRVDHGRLQQVLHVLRRAVHARRGSLAAVRRRADRSSPTSPTRASWKSRCSGRTSTPIARRWVLPARPARAPISRRSSNTSPTFPASSASATPRRIRRR